MPAEGIFLWTLIFRIVGVKERGYDHHTVNHGEGEYASGKGNEIHTNNCECRISLSKWWLKKHHGVSKWHLAFYYQVVPVRAQPPLLQPQW